jgi:predicted dehydrogenase
MAEPLRIGLVGAGRILPAHLRGYAELRAHGFDDFRITAICSRDRDRALTYRKRGEGPPPAPPTSSQPSDGFGAPHRYVSDFQDDVLPEIYGDVRAMLDAGAVDAVDIVTEVNIHHTQALACFEAGVHAVVEKPLAISMRAGRRMVDEARRRGLVLAVCENAHFNTLMRHASWLLERGDLGTPQMACWWSIGTNDWSPDRFVGNSPWRHQKLIGGGGASIDVGPHIFHRLRMLCGEVEQVSAFARVIEPERVLIGEDGKPRARVSCDTDDAFMAVATFASGAIGQLSFTFAGHGGPTAGPMPLLYGSRGCLRGDTLFLDGAEPEPLATYFERRATDAERERLFPRSLADAFGLLLGDVVAAIREGREAEASGEEGLRDLAASLAVVESSLARRAVTLREVLDGTVDAYQRELDKHYGLA